jgi:hypothetical protein
MAKVGSFLHNSEYGIGIAATTTYDTARSLEIDLWKDSPGVIGNQKAVAMLGGLYIKIEGAVGAVAKLTMRLCRDADGDDSIIGDTEADISFGVTTATDGTVTFYMDNVPYIYTDRYVYLFWKVDADSCDVTNVSLTWKE